MMLESKAKTIEKAMVEKSIADLPWQMIMEFIMQMVQTCFPSSASAVESKQMGPARKAALGVWIRREFGIRGMRKVNEVREVMLAEFDSSTNEEIEAMWRETKQEMYPDLSVV